MSQFPTSPKAIAVTIAVVVLSILVYNAVNSAIGNKLPSLSG